MFDTIRVRLIEIGESVRDTDPTTLATEPTILWLEIARMRDDLTHPYFDTAHSMVRSTAEHDIPRRIAAVVRLLT